MTEMWERFTYYGMRGILILFLVDAVATGGFGLDDRRATAIYGLYTTATYLMALPGWLADRLLGRRAVAWAALILAGNTLLAIPAGPTLFYLGCLVVVVGVGLLKPNISAMVAQLYPQGGAARDAGFTLFYMGINIGALVGSLATPWLAHGTAGGRVAGTAVAMALGSRSSCLRITWVMLKAASTHPPCSQPTSGSGAESWWCGCRRRRHDADAAGIIARPDAVARWTAVAIVVVTVAYFSYLLAFATASTA
jgi:POT family proton-dependent oligopeptide transporter